MKPASKTKKPRTLNNKNKQARKNHSGRHPLYGMLKQILAASTRVTTEVKLPSGKTTSVCENKLDAQAVTAFRNLFRTSNNQVFRMTLRAGVLATASAGGVTSISQTVDPSNGGAQDWSSMAAIFDLFRVNEIKATISSRGGSATGGSATDYRASWGYYIAFDANSTPTPAIATLLDCDNVQLVSGKAGIHRYVAKIPRLAQLDWTPTSSPSGAVGAISLYGEEWVPSVASMELMFEYDIEFMMKGV